MKLTPADTGQARAHGEGEDPGQLLCREPQYSQHVGPQDALHRVSQPGHSSILFSFISFTFSFIVLKYRQ
jgi:hypothetical protein